MADGEQKNRRENKIMSLVKASGKYIRVSPFKIRPLVDQIRGKEYAAAREILMFSPKLTAKYVVKVLDSAAANAENNNKVSKDELYISEAQVGEGPTLKRVRFRAMGRVNRIRKRTSHVTIGLSKKGEE